jgi:hypothetical protein
MANNPKRIQRRRTAGWRMPDNTKSVARPSRWGNPFKVEGNHQAAVDQFTQWVEQQGALMQAIRSELRGRDLACYCKPEQPCHADVLLRIANT